MPRVLEFVKTYKLVEAMDWREFDLWLCCPIYSIETHKLCSYKEV
jgi:hypothetical protein